VEASDEAKERVHIFAHSMGGLDARCAISKNIGGVVEHVATLVTIGTPHLGSPVADRIAAGGVPGVNLKINQRALHDLTTTAARRFNAEMPDDAQHDVRYRYVAGDMTAPGARASQVFGGIAA